MNSDPSRDESGVCEREVLFIYGQSPRGTFVVCRVKNQIPKSYTLLLAIGIYLTVCEQSVDWKAFGIFLKNWLIHNVSSFYLLLPKCLILFLFALSSPKWNVLRPRVASWYVKMQLVSMVVKLDLCARTKVRHTGPLAYDPVYNPYMLINMIFFLLLLLIILGVGLIYPPTYSPEENTIEYCFSISKKRLARNQGSTYCQDIIWAICTNFVAAIKEVVDTNTQWRGLSNNVCSCFFTLSSPKSCTNIFEESWSLYKRFVFLGDINDHMK